MKRLNQNVVNKNINVLKALRGWTDEEIAFKIGLSSSGYAKRKKNGNWSLNEAQCLSGLAGVTIEEFFLHEYLPNGKL